MEGQNLMPSLTPARTQTLAPSMSLPPTPHAFLRLWATFSLVPFYPCQTLSPGLTPALAEQKAASHMVTLSHLLGQETADVHVGKEVSHVLMHLGGTAAPVSG